jgi:hyperosmotically inducible protein
VDDTVITTKVKAALLADEVVKGMDISVKTVGGEVQLTGVVDNQAQMDRAVEVAKGIEGAARVQNGMTVKQ